MTTGCWAAVPWLPVDIGVALAPILALKNIRPSTGVLPVRPPTPVRRVLFVPVSDHVLTSAVQTFAEHLRRSTTNRIEMWLPKVG